MNCRNYTKTSHPKSPRSSRNAQATSNRNSLPTCKWAAGSAATATAIRTSMRTRCKFALVAPVDDDPRILSGGSACTGRGTVDFDLPRRRQPGSAGAGRRLARQFRAPHRRTIPSCTDRHVCAAGCDGARLHGTTNLLRREVGPRVSLHVTQRVLARSADPDRLAEIASRHRADQAASRQIASRLGDFRLPHGHARHAPEFRRA